MIKDNFISILITNYNKGKFLNKNLKQICNQKFKNYEVLLYDDCSSDNSIEIIKKFKKVKLIKKLIRIKKSAPINQIRGILKIFKMCKGNIICLLDADDSFLKYKLLEIDKFFRINKKLNCVFDMPKINHNNFKFKKKVSNINIWPTIFPTSCISIRKNFFKNFAKHAQKKKFDYLEIDARIIIFANFFYNEYNIINKKLTLYNYDPNGITADIKKYSKKWWRRRYQAHLYLKTLFKKKNVIYNLSIDYCITAFFNLFLRK